MKKFRDVYDYAVSWNISSKLLFVGPLLLCYTRSFWNSLFSAESRHTGKILTANLTSSRQVAESESGPQNPIEIGCHL